MIGIGIGLPYRRRAQGVAVTSPAAGTTFYTLEATSVTLAGLDGTYESSWQSDFATTNGDIVVSGGTGTGNVTPAWADGIASPERATLYLRNKAVGGAATGQTSAPIYTSPHAAVQDGTIALAYDLGRASTVTQAAGVCTEWQPIVGGTSADYLTAGAVGTDAIYSASDSDFGGRPSIAGTGTEWMQTTGSGEVSTAQPYCVVAVGKPTTVHLQRYFDSANVAKRSLVYANTGYLSLYAGTGVLSTIAVSADPSLLIADFDSAGQSRARNRKSDGTLEADPIVGTPNTQDAQGLTLFARYDGNTPSVAKLTAWLRVTGLTAADVYRLEQWKQLTAVRGGCAATGWTAQLDASCYLECAGYWPTDPTDGTVSVAEATIDDDLTTWGQTNVTNTSGTSDPLGGTDAYSITIAGGLGSVAHYTNKTTTNGEDTYLTLDVWLRQQSVRYCQLRWGSAGHEVSGYVDMQTGSTSGFPAGSSASIIESVGDWDHWTAELFGNDIGTNQILLGPSEDGATTTFDAGAGMTALDVYGLQVTQIRVSNVADQSGLGADLAQATGASQPIFWDLTENGLVLPHKEDGRAVHMSSSHATVVAVGNAGASAYAAFAFFGVGQLFSAGSSSRAWFLRWEGTGYDRIITVDSSGNYSASRYDGTSTDGASYVGCPANALATPKAFAIVSNSSGTRELWIGGSGPYTATLGALLAVTQTLVRAFGYTVGDDDCAAGQMAFLVGQVPGANAAARYAYVEPALAQMADKYGLST